MAILKKCFLLLIMAIVLGACSYTPEEQAKYDEMRAFWRQNNGYGGSNR